MSQDLYEVLPDLVAALESMGAGTDRNLIITGHSLGGSLSNLAAANLAADGFNVSGKRGWEEKGGEGTHKVESAALAVPPLTCPRAPLSPAVYTWAAGRVGDDRFAQLYRDLGLQGRTLRFNNQVCGLAGDGGSWCAGASPTAPQRRVRRRPNGHASRSAGRHDPAAVAARPHWVHTRWQAGARLQLLL